MTSDAPTQRAYRTDVGVVSWQRASAAAQHIVDGGDAPDQRRVLSALFATVFRAHKLIDAGGDAGLFDGVRAAQLLQRLCERKHDPYDTDALWALLFKIFQR